MLSDRKAAILQAVVEGYISTSTPVGSTYVTTAAPVDVSPATVRSEMTALEDAGYLIQPHTSAGRVPTDKGYRYFVDSLMTPYQVGQAEQQRVKNFFDTAQGELERMLKSTSGFLANLTDYAALVTAPNPVSGLVRAVDLIRLEPDQLMALMVLQDGSIARHTFSIDATTEDDTVASSNLLLRERLVGKSLDDADLSATGNRGVDGLVADAVAGIKTLSAVEPQVYLGGTAGVAGIFDAVEQVREVLAVLDKQYVVVTLLKDMIDRGLSVAIGSETGVAPLADCAVVIAPYEVEGASSAGTIALLGPSRMNYPEAMATVAMVSQQLGHRLSEG